MKKLRTKAVVFCIIDGKSLYENDKWLEGTCYALKAIGNLARDPEVSAKFKLLVTSPLACRYVARDVQDADHLVLPHNERGDDGIQIRYHRRLIDDFKGCRFKDDDRL